MEKHSRRMGTKRCGAKAIIAIGEIVKLLARWKKMLVDGEWGVIETLGACRLEATTHTTQLRMGLGLLVDVMGSSNGSIQSIQTLIFACL
jgi:hypothetical protein